MSSRKLSTSLKQAAQEPTLRERAAQTRDAAGRFIRRSEGQVADQGQPAETPPVRGTVRVPITAHPDTYGLRVDEDGLGLHAAPGATVMVEPVLPTKAGLAVFYLKGARGPLVFDLTRNFQPKFVGPFAPGSEVMPLIEVVTPASGQFGRIRADIVEKLHRIIGVYTPAEIAENHLLKPTPLPEVARCPDGMGEQYVKGAAAYPLVRPGETVVFDPSLRDPVHGALVVVEWSNGKRDVLLTNLRSFGGRDGEMWFVDPLNRPSNDATMKRRLARNAPGDLLYASDGPFTKDHLHEKIVGTVVGILALR